MKTFIFILGFFGVFMLIGSVGANEQGNISLTQMFIQEAIAIGCLLSAFGLNALCKR